MRSSRPATARHIWHPIGDAAGVRRILRLWETLLKTRHLAELPDDGHPYWSMVEILRGGEDHRARLLRQPGAAYDVVAIDLWRLRELTVSLEWLYAALREDHEGKYERLDGHWVVREDVEDPPCTGIQEARMARKSLGAMIEAAYERLAKEKR